MNEDINFCEILKGHEGEIFYNPLLGNIELARIEDKYIVFIYNGGLDELFIKHDGSSVSTDELAIFPSKDQRDWNKWIENSKTSKIPKIWSEYIDSEYYEWNEVIGHISTKEDPIHKSMFALLKIYQLIEVSYGGNITTEEWHKEIDVYYIYPGIHNKFYIDSTNLYGDKRHIAFHIKEQAKEFLKYEENIQLLKDYFIIN